MLQLAPSSSNISERESDHKNTLMKLWQFAGENAIISACQAECCVSCLPVAMRDRCCDLSASVQLRWFEIFRVVFTEALFPPVHSALPFILPSSTSSLLILLLFLYFLYLLLFVIEPFVLFIFRDWSWASWIWSIFLILRSNSAIWQRSPRYRKCKYSVSAHSV